MTPGRNDGCPCGSGKKYKHCCLRAAVAAVDTPDVLAWRRVRRALDEFSTPSTLLAFIGETYGAEALAEAWEDFSGTEEPFDPQTPHMQIFMPWFFYRWSPDPHDTAIEDVALHGREPTALYLERASRKLDPIMRRYLAACLKAPFSFFEILRCDIDRGFRARDVFTGEEREVMERSATQGMQPGDLLFGQLVDAEGITILECSGPCLIPPIYKIELIDFRKKILRGEPRISREALCDWDFELIACYLDVLERVLHPALPSLHNTDGEPIQMHRLSFDVDSPQQAFDALKDLDFDRTTEDLLADAHRTASGELEKAKWDWKKPGNELHASWTNTILGHIEIKGRRLTAEVNSARRAEEFKSLIAERLGEAARLRGDTIASMERMLEEALEAGPAAPSPEEAALNESPDLQAHVRRMMAEHYERWVSDQIPALGGRTPLEAVRDPDGREKVAALLLDAERLAGRMKTPMDPAVLHRVRERLGLA